MSQNKETVSLYSDIPKIQKISSYTALSAVLITIAIPFIFNLERTALRNIIITGIIASLFAVIYYSIPKLYLNPKFILITDFIFTVAISIVMLNLGQWGFFYVIFFILILAIDAFTYEKRKFIIAVSMVVLALISVNYLQIGTHHLTNINDFYFTTAFQLYWVLSLAVILRIFAKEALDLRNRKENLEKTLQTIEREEHEILTLLNSLGDMIIAFDSKGKLNFANKAAKNLLNISPKTAGKEIEELVYEEKDKSESLKALLKGKRVYKNDVRIKLGDTKRVNIAVTPIYGSSEKYEGSILFIHILTEQEEVEKTKIEFAAIASHELRTPLAVIEGYIHLLLSNKKLAEDTEVSGYLKTIKSTLQELIELSNNILTITKLESNTIRFNKEKVNVNQIIEDVSKEYAEKAQEKSLKIFLSGKEIPEILSDASKIKEIVSNLLDNAIKFTTNGTITIEMGKINDKTIEISVIDTGAGIKRSDQNKIFNKFFTVEDWETRKTGGTGLGLFISKSLAEMIGGNVKLKSEESLGSKFTLELPVK